MSQQYPCLPNPIEAERTLYALTGLTESLREELNRGDAFMAMTIYATIVDFCNNAVEEMSIKYEAEQAELAMKRRGVK